MEINPKFYFQKSVERFSFSYNKSTLIKLPPIQLLRKIFNICNDILCEPKVSAYLVQIGPESDSIGNCNHVFIFLARNSEFRPGITKKTDGRQYSSPVAVCVKLGPKGKTLHIDINTYAKSPSSLGILEYL